MAFDLNPHALQNEPVLRALASPPKAFATVAAFAEHVGRDADNLRKTLKVLQREDLIGEQKPLPEVTDAGRAQLAALDRAGDPTAAGGLTATHGDLEPHPLNPRKDFESDEAQEYINELRESMLTRRADGQRRGVLQPIVVRPHPTPGKWWIMDGECRWRAVAQAIWDGDWEETDPLPIAMKDADDAEHLMLSLTANIQRRAMLEIEEGVAFDLAVREFGLSTEDIAGQVGKSQRYVQQRIALLKLSPEDQERMRLPRDHVDRLSFKQARGLTQTARPADPSDRPPPTQELSQALATHGAAKLGGGEPGSSPTAPATPPEEPDFDSKLSHKEALLLVEVADKSDRDPAPEFAPEPYARVQAVPVRGEAQSLVEKNVLGFRQRGMHVFVRARLRTSGAHDWLVGLGFYGEHRADVLFEMRARVLGHDRARQLAEQGEYATPWLNPPGDPMQDGGAGRMPGPMDAMADYAAERRQAEPDEPHQPELIQPTPEEEADRARRRQEAADRQVDEQAVDAFAVKLKAKLAETRAKGRRGWNDPNICTVESLAADLVRHVAKGDPIDIGAFAMFVSYRGGPVWSGQCVAAAWDEAIEAAKDTPQQPFETAHEAAERRLRRHNGQAGDVTVTAEFWPTLHAAFEAISHDGGSSAGHDAYFVPARWEGSIDAIEAVLAAMDAEERDERFVLGEATEVEALVASKPELAPVHQLLDEFFEDFPVEGSA